MHKQFELNGDSYRLLDRYCNKEKCKCHEGSPHGPYWYVHTTDEKKYVGKTLPPEILEQLENLEKLTPKAHKKIDVLEGKMRELRKSLSNLQDQKRSLVVAMDGGYLNSAEKEYLVSVGLGQMIGE